jgi:hypothetical protein
MFTQKIRRKQKEIKRDFEGQRRVLGKTDREGGPGYKKDRRTRSRLHV